MDLMRSRNAGRPRSPYKSRSRSRSASLGRSRRGRRSRSRERLRHPVSPRDRRYEKSPVRRVHGSRTRSPSFTPPRTRETSAHLRSGLNAEPTERPNRLRRPEIQSSVHPVPDTSSSSFIDLSTFVMSHPSPPSLPLTERFDRLTNAGTSVYNNRTYRRPTDSRHIPHLIITNNTKLPPATLIRQAKAISIVIDRKLPQGKRRPVDDEPFDPRRLVVTIPRRLNEGLKPVFDRPEIQFYLNVLDEAQISQRLLDCISSSSVSKQPLPSSDRRSRSSQYQDVVVVGPGRFYGSRVDESGRSRYVHPLDPSETPRNSAYFLHDDREEPSSYNSNRRDWSARARYRAGGFRREPDARNRSRSPPVSYQNLNYNDSARGSHRSSVDSADRWKHDKFEQLMNDEGGPRASDRHASASESTKKPLPKPVPAPKPILWSTIGNDVVTNGQSQVASGKHDYTPQSSTGGRSPVADHESQPMDEDLDRSRDAEKQSQPMNSNVAPEVNTDYDAAEDVRIDAEPVLDDAMEG